MIVEGDCRDRLTDYPDDHFDSVVCDPPYGLSKPPDMTEVLSHWIAGDDYEASGGGFMGKTWDSFVPGPATWSEILRVLKPGGHLVCFAGTRTWDMMGLSLRLAGFDVRDTIMWLYGQGFPKSHNVSKALDKMAGAERKVTGETIYACGRSIYSSGDLGVMDDDGWGGGAARVQTAPATPEAEQWEGWGTALKPAWEPIIMARKPFKGTVAANVTARGTGAINIDACRIGWSDDADKAQAEVPQPALNSDTGMVYGFQTGEGRTGERFEAKPEGRWPANVALSHHPECKLVGERSVEDWACRPDCPVGLLDTQTGPVGGGGGRGAPPGSVRKKSSAVERDGNTGAALGAESRAEGAVMTTYDDHGGASRFFYVAKASRRERNVGLPNGVQNKHPTVKPVKLMEWLVRMVTPPGGVVLDPFCGSGTTGVAAVGQGFEFVGIDDDAESVRVARYRVGHAHDEVQGDGS